MQFKHLTNKLNIGIFWQHRGNKIMGTIQYKNYKATQ